MKVMLDTNILLSAGLFGSKRVAQYIDLLMTRYIFYISDYSLFEFFDNIDRKFQSKRACAEAFINKIPHRIIKTPAFDKSTLPYIRDEKDYPILAAALYADIDVLITGDRDFRVVETDRPEIMTVAEFVAKYMGE
jgi:putative PIN family toxin of toxin-antitoxin system